MQSPSFIWHWDHTPSTVKDHYRPIIILACISEHFYQPGYQTYAKLHNQWSCELLEGCSETCKFVCTSFHAEIRMDQILFAHVATVWNKARWAHSSVSVISIMYDLKSLQMTTSVTPTLISSLGFMKGRETHTLVVDRRKRRHSYTGKWRKPLR